MNKNNIADFEEIAVRGSDKQGNNNVCLILIFNLYFLVR